MIARLKKKEKAIIEIQGKEAREKRKKNRIRQTKNYKDSEAYKE